MHLNEIDRKVNTQKIAELLKEYFGYTLDVEALTEEKSRKLLASVRGKINEIKLSSAYHAAEKNPRYMGLVMLEKTLATWQAERIDEKITKKTPAGEIIKDFQKSKDPKFKGKSKEQRKKQALGAYYGMHPEKSKKANEASEAILRAKFLLQEGEVDQAQAILAGQDLVDRMQKMLEDLSKMQNEELPPLASTIRDNLSAEQSDAFIATANEVISGALDVIRQSREQLDVAVRQMAGEQVGGADMGADMGGDMGSAGADMMGGADMGAGDAADMGTDVSAETGDQFGATPPAIGGEEPLGRGRREDTVEI